MCSGESEEQYSDRELVRGFRSGNSRIVKRLLDKCMAAVGRLIGQASIYGHHREVIVHDSVVEVLESLDGFEFHCSLDTWIWRVAAKRYASWVDRDANQPSQLPPDELPDTKQQSVPELVEAAERQDFLGKCLLQIREPYRITLSLFYLGEHSCKESLRFWTSLRALSGLDCRGDESCYRR